MKNKPGLYQKINVRMMVLIRLSENVTSFRFQFGLPLEYLKRGGVSEAMVLGSLRVLSVKKKKIKSHEEG